MNWLTKHLQTTARAKSPEMLAQDTTNEVLNAVSAERGRQRRLWGNQRTLPDGIRVPGDYENEINAKLACARREIDGAQTWRSVLVEEVAEVCNATDSNLETELIQVAAVATAWIEAIRERKGR